MQTFRFLFLSATAATVLSVPAYADEAAVARGEYLVSIAGCGDCHTPGYFLGQPDFARALGGSEVGFEIPGLGTFYGPNLTPDEATGLGAWSETEIVAAFTTGVRPDGRVLAPAMPWMGYANFTPEDAAAIAAFLKSIPPVSNRVPGPFGPDEAATAFVMRVIPPGG
ncbi:MAG TPA: cytochrome c [Tabrizicola sp.]|nr:cytochrome c [Tabrizicola sp.]